MPDDASRRILFGPSPPRRSASDARLRAMAMQLIAARGQVEEIEEAPPIACPRRVVLLGLARRSLPVCDQAKLIGLAKEGEESTACGGP